MLNTQEILDELNTCNSTESIAEFFQTYLSKKGLLNAQFKTMKDLTPDERKTVGSDIKQQFESIEKSFFAQQDDIKKKYRDSQLASEPLDISTPVSHTAAWDLNLQNKLRRRVEEIFQGMWFQIEYGHHLVSIFENFESVNIPATHPATEMHDTLYVDAPNKDGSIEKKIMRTHTSAHQSELIRKYGPECKFIIPSKVYRNENMDASHDCMFWQVEWVVIGKGISIAHFKSMIEEILKAILETDQVTLRLRPWYFPFTEPGFEIDAWYQMGSKEKRLEILWAGMIHPHVLEQAGVDPDTYSWFAFGIWLSRLVAIKYGISDIRVMTNGDLRFAQSRK